MCDICKVVFDMFVNMSVNKEQDTVGSVEELFIPPKKKCLWYVPLAKVLMQWNFFQSAL